MLKSCKNVTNEKEREGCGRPCLMNIRIMPNNRKWNRLDEYSKKILKLLCKVNSIINVKTKSIHTNEIIIKYIHVTGGTDNSH